MCICVLKLTFLLIPVLGKPFFLIIFTGRKKSRKDIRFSSWCCFPYMLWKTKQRSKDNQVHIWASGILKPGSWVARSFLTRSLVAKKPPSVSSEDLAPWIVWTCQGLGVYCSLVGAMLITQDSHSPSGHQGSALVISLLQHGTVTVGRMERFLWVLANKIGLE